MQIRAFEDELNGSKYSVVATPYADSIHLAVHKNERIAQVYRCQLYPQPGGVLADDGLVAGITPETVLGGGDSALAGQLYTQIIGSLLLKQTPEESRTLILSLGDIGPRSNADITTSHREELLFVIGLVQRALASQERSPTA